MARHRTYSIDYKRRVVLGGPCTTLAKRHNISRYPIPPFGRQARS